MTRLLDQILIYVLAASLVFGGWNWWRKNVYYDALNNVAAAKVEQARAQEQTQRDALGNQARALQEQYDVRANALQRQLDEIGSTPPAERVVYRLRERWLPVSCPAATGGDGNDATYGGLQPADEQFLVRFADEADRNTEQLAACQAAVNTLTQKK